MLSSLINILNFILQAFLHIWPYLLLTIPLAVAIQVSGISRYITVIFNTKPVIGILLATLIGAFSPFCSCGVIPVISSLLISGVPLGPVMSFWIASPSMDPEIFFLSVSTIGWNLAWARLVATLVLSLSAGLITQALANIKFFPINVMRVSSKKPILSGILISGWRRMKLVVRHLFSSENTLAIQPVCCDSTKQKSKSIQQPFRVYSSQNSGAGCTCAEQTKRVENRPVPTSLYSKILTESGKTILMVSKFMALTFALEAIIHFYVPQDWIRYSVGANNAFAVPLATILGIPLYTTSLTALPVVGGLLEHGMNSGAALAFLIAGPTTTLPAMAAVFGIVKWRIFVLYLSFVLVGALASGYLYNLIAVLL